MGSLSASADLIASYEKLDIYPQNLANAQVYSKALHSYRDRLENASDALFGNESSADVPFRDLDAAGTVVARKNIFSDDKLKDHLGDTTAVDPHGNVIGRAFSRADPKCRFIFLWANSSLDRLKITKKMLTRILSYHQVMPRFLEFLFLFGERTFSLELRYSGFREQTQLSAPPPGQQNLDIGRSGRQYQLCYNLKTVNCVSDPSTVLESRQWRIRQAAIYHSLDVECGTALWIFIKGDLELKERVQEVTGANGRPQDQSFRTAVESFRSSLAIHTMSVHFATDDWRWYVQWLETVVHKNTQADIVGTKSPSAHRKNYTPEDLQSEQYLEEKANEATMIIESNSTVFTALKDYYEDLAKASPFGESIDGDVTQFSALLKDAIADMKVQSSRTQLLAQMISQRKLLVLQYLQAQASEKMEQLAAMSQRETIAMRIITVVTLFYLPGTFVSTIFSTDIVKFQNQDNTSADTASSGVGFTFSQLALNIWLAFTLPLMFLTFLISWLAYKRKAVSLRKLVADTTKEMSLLPLAKSVQ